MRACGIVGGSKGDVMHRPASHPSGKKTAGFANNNDAACGAACFITGKGAISLSSLKPKTSVKIAPVAAPFSSIEGTE